MLRVKLIKAQKFIVLYMRTRAWCFTLNNYSEKEYETIKGVSCRYIVVGKEVGDSGTPHLQGYIEFDNPRVMAGVKK